MISFITHWIQNHDNIKAVGDMKMGWSRYTIKMINSSRHWIQNSRDKHESPRFQIPISKIQSQRTSKSTLEERKCADPDLALTWGHQTPNTDIGDSKSSNIKIDIEMDIESNQIVEHRHRHRIKSNQIIKNTIEAHIAYACLEAWKWADPDLARKWLVL